MTQIIICFCLLALIFTHATANFIPKTGFGLNRSPTKYEKIKSGTSDIANNIDTGTKKLSEDKEQLFEAYNLLHSLAQDFKKPFDSPAVLVVGHQTSGKSALLEALMGFQFNQVGGGTKTRRPVALRMQYNPDCKTPLCFLTLENGREEQKSLSDIQVRILCLIFLITLIISKGIYRSRE